MKTILSCFTLIAALLLITQSSHAANVTVDARCNIFGAGHNPPNDTPSVVGGGGVPPVEIPLAAIGSSGEITLRAVGTVTFKPGEPYNGPDGDGIYYAVPSYNGVSGIKSLRRSLVAVFLSDEEPVEPSPAALDFSVIGKDYAEIFPSINQLFYVGDGVESVAGLGQRIHVPVGATRLYLGFVDGFGSDVPGWYDDNLGSFLVSVFDTSVGGGVDASYVSAKCNIFGSGHVPPNDTPSIAGGGGIPPVVVDLQDLNCGSTLSFGATGLVSYDGTLPFNGPDGDGPFYAVPAYNGISGINCPRRSLIGVFIVAGVEPTDPAPASLDFAGGGINYLTLSPLLNQMFFIGDGIANASAALQQVRIPAGATKLCLGVVDGFGVTQVPGWYNDNRGGFMARVVRSADGSEAEVCNGIDDDCDGLIDEGVKQTFYHDADDDGFGNPNETTEACGPVEGYVADFTDCDDSNAAVHPDAAEVCNDIDDDCDGMIDEGVRQTFYRDADGDGYGNVAETIDACGIVDGYATDSTDCDDGDGDVHPGAAEVCNGVDDDCDGLVDEGVKQLFYMDADGDGYGNPSAPLESCGISEGYVADSTDCDDGNATVHPGAPEACNGIDDDCNGLIDEGVTMTLYRDADGDGYGNAEESISACGIVEGYVTDSRDCSDGNDMVHPGAVEVCNGSDDDCDGLVDEGVSRTFYRDADGDGFGDANTAIEGCSPPDGYVTDAADCNDADVAVNPGTPEVCNGIDDNCDGQVDESCSGDEDQDGVPDETDQCPGTSGGQLVDIHGCSVSQLAPCNGPWKNHGDYVSTVADIAGMFVTTGVLTAQERAIIVSEAARSDCGKKAK